MRWKKVLLPERNPTARWKRLNATGDGNGDEDGKNLKNEYRTKQERSGRQKTAAKGNEDAKGVRDDRVTHALGSVRGEHPKSAMNGNGGK